MTATLTTLLILAAAAIAWMISWTMRGARARTNEAATGARLEAAVQSREDVASQLRALEARHSALLEQLRNEATARAAAEATVATIHPLRESLADAQTAAANAAEDLAEQRETVSNLAAKLEADRATIQDLRERGASLATAGDSLRDQLAERDRTLTDLREQMGGMRAEREAAEAAIQRLTDTCARAESERAELATKVSTLTIANAELETSLAAERSHAEEKLGVLLNARLDMLNEFKALSSEILEEKSKRFTEQNASTLGQLLNPLKEQLQGFHSKVDEVYRTEGQERAALGEQLKHIVQLNQSLSLDAQKLTRALKGDQKAQGTWGEIVLDTVLEQAGLIEGTHYDRQTSLVGEDQKRAVPDIVIRLPGDRRLVVDSKVSLTAYERGAAALTPEEQEIHLKQHVTSVRNHIRSLSEKNYQQLYELKSIDFVLLFVPLEPAFAAAVSHDNLIFRDAWDRNVILVGPSTLLFVIRTVAYLWRQESQARNVIEIAKRGAALYDKFCGFVDSLEEVGKRVQQAAKAYDGAMSKLAVGEGNLVRQAELLRELGIKPSKQLPTQLVDRALSKAQQSLISSGVESAEPGEDATSDAESALPTEAGAAMQRDGVRA